MDNSVDGMGTEFELEPDWNTTNGSPGEDLALAADLEPMDSLLEELLAQSVNEVPTPADEEVEAVVSVEPAVTAVVEALAPDPVEVEATQAEAWDDQPPEPDEADWAPVLPAFLNSSEEDSQNDLAAAAAEEAAAIEEPVALDLSAPEFPAWTQPPPEPLLAPAPEIDEEEQTQPEAVAEAAPEEPVTGTFDLQPVEPEPVDAATEDFARPVEDVLAELASIVAKRGAARWAEAKQAEQPARPALPPQPPIEEVLARLDAALAAAPALPAPKDGAATPHRQFSQLDDYVVFTLAGVDYAIPVRDVAEIGRLPVITRVPNVPDFVRGLTNLRGEVVPVLSLLALLGTRETAPSAQGRVLFLQTAARGAAAGLVVDEVRGIERIESQHLESVSGLVDDKLTSVLRGVHGRGDRLLNVLDLGQLFKTEEFLRLQA
jgi:purine-binding chemotaxis protein CheW